MFRLYKRFCRLDRALLLTGDLNAIQAARIVGAVPFSFIMILMGIVLLKALDRYGLREQRLAQKEAPCNSQHKS